MAAEIGIASGEKGSGIRVSATGGKYMPKGVTRGGEGGAGAATGGAAWAGRLGCPWLPSGPTSGAWKLLER